MRPRPQSSIHRSRAVIARRTILARVAILFIAPIVSPSVLFADASISTAVAQPRTVKASKKGIELELTLADTRIRRDAPLFVRVRLKNLSKRQMVVSDWIFRGADNLPSEWTENSTFQAEPYIEVQAPNGKNLKPLDGVFDAIGLPHDAGQKSPIDVYISSWVAAGLSTDEINRRLPEKEAELRDAKYPEIKLRTGQSATTASWCSERSLDLTGTLMCPGDGFVELKFAFDKPGRYRLRMVYDHRMPEALKRALRRKGLDASEDEWQVRTATPWIDFEVHN